MAATQTKRLALLGVKPPVLDYLRSLWARREFAIEIPKAELAAQHRNTVLGGIWHILNPLMLVGVYYVIFGIFVRTGRGIDNFVGFLAVGIFVFHFTTNSVRAGARSIVGNEGLLRAVSFPRAILPISVVLSEFVALVYAFAAMFAIVLLTGEEPGWTWLLVVPISAVQLLFNLGLAMMVARLADRYRDILQVVPYTLRIWGYASGIFYDPLVRAAEYPTITGIIRVNPGFLYMHLSRRALLDNAAPTAQEWGLLVLWGVVILVLGLIFFLRKEHEYGRA